MDLSKQMGEKNSHAIITEEQAKLIKAHALEYKNTTRNLRMTLIRKLSTLYNVSTNIIYGIVRDKTWKHI